MKTHYVKTSNYNSFIAGVHKIQNGASRSSRLLLASGEPATGKTHCVNFYGSLYHAIYIEGVPELTVSAVKDNLSYELGLPKMRGFDQTQAIDNAMSLKKQMIIFDEAQHGLDKKGAVLETLRRICDKSDTMLVLVCHTSERHRFAEQKMAHIATRISAHVTFTPATIEDTQLYYEELCEVKIDDACVIQAFTESRGRYRLLYSAGRTMEEIAKKLGKTNLTGADIKGITLCEDAMTTYSRKGR